MICSERTFQSVPIYQLPGSAEYLRGVCQKQCDWCTYYHSLNLSNNIKQEVRMSNEKVLLILKHLYRRWGHQRLWQWLGHIEPPVLHSVGLEANVQLSIMKIDLNWDLWLLNGWHWGIFLSREWGSQYGTYKRPINNVRAAYKTFTEWVKALHSGSSASSYAWEYRDNFFFLSIWICNKALTYRAFSSIYLLTALCGGCKFLFTEMLWQREKRWPLCSHLLCDACWLCGS